MLEGQWGHNTNTNFFIWFWHKDVLVRINIQSLNFYLVEFVQSNTLFFPLQAAFRLCPCWPLSTNSEAQRIHVLVFSRNPSLTTKQKIYNQQRSEDNRLNYVFLQEIEQTCFLISTFLKKFVVNSSNSFPTLQTNVPKPKLRF